MPEPPSRDPVETLAPHVAKWLRPNGVRRRRYLAPFLANLPRTHCATFATRCAERVRVLLRVRDLRPKAYLIGIDPPPRHRHGRDAYVAAATTDAAAADNAVAYDHDAATADAADAADAAARAVTDARAAAAAIFADLARLQELPPEELIRWDDPRLGPLWPDGPPKWHVEAEEWCKMVEEKIAMTKPEPESPPIHEDLATRLATHELLHRQLGAGKFEGYRGEYIIAAPDGSVLSHHPRLKQAKADAAKLAQSRGIPAGRLTNYYVPTLD